MYRNSCQRGMLTVLFGGGSKPLGIWETFCKDGNITTFLDQDIKAMVVEITGTNVSTTYMVCPKGKTVLGISMPFLVMIVKNLKKYFTFEVTILDETGTRRRFRVANFQSTTQILPLSTAMPIGLSDGWNQIQFNLADFTRRAYNKNFVEVQKIRINANIRIRRIYFAERLIPEDELPPEYKLYFPIKSKSSKGRVSGVSEAKKEEPVPTASMAETETKSEEKKGSATEVAKASSKQSLHSPKKSSSKASAKEEVEGEKPEAKGDVVEGGSRKASVVNEDEVEAVVADEAVTGEATPVEDKPAEVTKDAEEQPAETEQAETQEPAEEVVPTE